MVRKCQHCKRRLNRKFDESSPNWKKRKYCNRTCANVYAHRVRARIEKSQELMASFAVTSYAEGLTLKETAELLGKSAGWVLDTLKKAGYGRRKANTKKIIT